MYYSVLTFLLLCIFSSIQLAGSSDPQEGEQQVDCYAVGNLPSTLSVEVEGNQYSIVDPAGKEDHTYTILQQ